ncbi:MAG: DUF222 domain-containing protein [Pseudonocardia sp.]
MGQERQIPDGLATIPPGPGLVAALAEIELDQVADGDAVNVLAASARQLAHEQARFFAAMVQVGRAATAQARKDTAHRNLGWEWVGAEIGAALTWTTAKADREHHIAEMLVEQLPLVFAELQAGRIDQGRAWTFVDVLGYAELTQAQTEHICATVVPLATGLTSGQIRARLLRLLISVDPGYAKRRYNKAVRERGIHGYLGKDGTATITGSGLGVDEAVAACERIEQLADTVKNAGHPATLQQIRADLFTRLLDGRLDGMGHDQMVTAMLTDLTTHPNTDANETPHTDTHETPDTNTQGTPDTNTNDAPAAAPRTGATGTNLTDPTDNGPDDPDDPDDPDEPDEPEPDDPGDPEPDDPDDPDEPEPDEPEPDEPEPDDLGDPADPRDPAVASSSLGPAGCGGVPTPQPRRGGEVRVGLATLMHRDEHPGEIPGWGPVIADVARAMVARQHRAQWRFAITDPTGHLILAGLTRRRPHDTADTADTAGECHGGIIELHLPAALLAELTAAESRGPWATVLADIAGQYTHRHRHQQMLDARPDDRFANALLRRHVQVRDRTCIAPGCRRPARRCDQDHTLDHELGGLTVAANSGPLCRRHHRMKHEGQWQLEQPRPGHFIWTSPLGHTYRTRGEPICAPQPDPAPHDSTQDTNLDEVERRAPYTGPILWPPPPEPPPPEPPPPPPPPRPADDDEPPF